MSNAVDIIRTDKGGSMGHVAAGSGEGGGGGSASFTPWNLAVCF